MKAGFIDQYSDLDSPLHRLDPRAKIAAFSLAVLVVASTPRNQLHAFPYYYLWIVLLLAISRVPVRYFAARCLVASPFILMAAALPYVSIHLDPGSLFGQAGVAPQVLEGREAAGQLALSVVLKAYAAIMLLTLLTATSRFHYLLWGMRRLKMPEVLTVIASLMYRYIFVLLHEWHRTTQARRLRSSQGLRMSRLSVYGKQIALVFLRGWERAERVQAAMVLRGFSGELPRVNVSRFQSVDAAFIIACAVLFLVVRFRIV